LLIGRTSYSSVRGTIGESPVDGWLDWISERCSRCCWSAENPYEGTCRAVEGVLVGLAVATLVTGKKLMRMVDRYKRCLTCIIRIQEVDHVTAGYDPKEYKEKETHVIVYMSLTAEILGLGISSRISLVGCGWGIQVSTW